MRCRRPAALAGVALAAAAAPALATPASQNCNGRFECSGFDFASGTSHTPPGGSQVCSFGHTELGGGACEPPCRDVRRAICRCKSKEEAEESVVAETRINLYFSIALLVIGLLCVGCKLKQRMDARRRQQQDRPLTAEVASVPAQQQQPCQQPPPVVYATVVGVPEPKAPEGIQAVAVSPDSIVMEPVPEREPSHFEWVARRNPTKARLLLGSIALFLPIFFVGYWVFEIGRSEGGIFEAYGVFMVFVGLMTYFSALAAFVVSYAMKVGLSAFRQKVNDQPLWFFIAVSSRIWLSLPVVGVAGIIWSIWRMNEPEGVYSVC